MIPGETGKSKTKADSMRKVHEHIIQIPPFVTRDQLWNGLEKAARHPDRFVEHMEGCELLSERLIEGRGILAGR